MTASSAPQVTVAVVGLGYVGLPLAELAHERGYRIVGIDIDEAKLARIRESHRGDPGFTATGDPSAMKGARVFVVCVPTPVTDDHTPDLRPLESASRSIAPYIGRGSVVIIESTVNPGVCEEVTLPILEAESGLKGELDFSLAHCPERINPGDPEWSVRNIPRVMGALGKKSLRQALSFYRSVLDAEITPMRDIKEAEAVKMVENSFRDINIAFVNELAMSFDKLGIDVMDVIRGASTKPFSFMPHYPGVGVGGHCIPVDPYYLITMARRNGFNHRFLSLAREINNAMPAYTLSRLEEAARERDIPLDGMRVAVLGLSYKADIEDLRESPSFKLIDLLTAKGVRVVTFDPYSPERSSAGSLDDAVGGSTAVVVATAHSMFKRRLTKEYLGKRGVRFLIDGRNCLKKERFARNGIVYRGIGR